ncbi:MAG: bifunctional serine/threonine-protein kinase/formylglycine-generating enzyme family protein, partial [Phycisphaerae bacterium]
MEEKLIGLESIEDFEASLVADVEAPRDEDERGSEDGAALEPTVEVSPEAEVIDDIPPAGTSPTKPSKKPGQSATGKKNKKKTSVAKWIGKRLGHYRLMRLLGSGAMGVVFQAEDVNLKRIAAIKVLRRRMSGQKQGKAVKRFLLEAQTAAALDHPGIARVYEINEHQGWWYIAMEFLEGGSLHEIVRATGPLDPGRAAIMLADASRALAAAHEGGVIHRDIKPANLMLNRQGRCKLVDFGMVKLDSAENPFHDDDQQILGTPFYVAPEVIQRKGASPASDMYSLGATAYALLTNSPPYTGEKINHVIKQHLEAPVPDPCIKSPMCSRVMGDLIRRAMAKDPDARPTAEAFAAAMQSEASVALVSDTGSIIGGSAVIGMSGSGGVFGSGGLSGSGATGAGSGTSGTNVLVDPAMHRTHVIPAGGRRQRLAWWVWGLVTFFALGSVGMGLWLSQQRPIDSSEYGGFSPVKTFGGSQGADDPQAPVLANFTNGIDMRMVPIPTGRFTIGSPPSEPHRNNDERMVEVELTRTVYMGVTEVTQRQWAEVMGNDYHPPEGVHPNEASGLRFVGDALPAYVSWLEAAEFCQRLSELEERYYRLPTEAEWERA